MAEAVKIYRGIDGDGQSVSVIAGDIDEWVEKTVEQYTGDPIGRPSIGSAITPIAEVSALVMVPIDDDRMLKYCEAIELDPGAERINDMICERYAETGLPIIPESIEEMVFKVDGAEDEEEERTVFAPVLEPNDGEDGAPLAPDKQDEIYSAEAIRLTAHYWAEHGGTIGLMHRFDVSDHVSVLETYIAPVTFNFASGDKKYKVRKGTWLLMLRINNDEMWQAIKDGELGAFSVGGSAIKRKEEIEVDAQ